MSSAQWTTQVNHTLVELSRRVECLEGRRPPPPLPAVGHSWVVRSHLVVDRQVGLAVGRLERGGRFVELVLPRLFRPDQRRFPGVALWLLWGRRRR